MHVTVSFTKSTVFISNYFNNGLYRTLLSVPAFVWFKTELDTLYAFLNDALPVETAIIELNLL